MIKKLILCVLLVMPLLSCCRSMDTRHDVTARITTPTVESRAELHKAVADMLNTDDVLLADDALTQSSILIIERKRHRNIQNTPASGRMLEKPERFQLLLRDKQCLLIHQNSGNSRVLKKTHCSAE